jgi:enoyl-CoA hydratase
MTELVLREDVQGVATLTLNRPDALNALSPNLFVALRSHIDAIAQSMETVGCVVLRGAGRSFSAGNDLKAIGRGEVAPTPTFQGETIEAIEALPQPVIVSVRGHCYTGALELVLAADLLVCSDTARFADTHGKWGMVPGWGMSQRLPRRVGLVKAKEMMFTARVVGHEEAAAIGLANEWVPDAELDLRVNELAASIVANSWHTLRGDKMLVRGGQDHPLSEGLAYERRENPGRSPQTEELVQGFTTR